MLGLNQFAIYVRRIEKVMINPIRFYDVIKMSITLASLWRESHAKNISWFIRFSKSFLLIIKWDNINCILLAGIREIWWMQAMVNSIWWFSVGVKVTDRPSTIMLIRIVLWKCWRVNCAKSVMLGQTITTIASSNSMIPLKYQINVMTTTIMSIRAANYKNCLDLSWKPIVSIT